MRRKIIYTLAFTGLIALATVLLVTNRKSTLRRGSMNFALADPSLADKIEISNRTDRLMLEKKADGWLLNAKYPARTETVNQFLQALGRIEVLSPASRSISDTLIRRIDERGNRLKITHGNRTLLSVAVYYERDLIPGTYMMDLRHRKPFRVGLTGYREADFEGLFHPVTAQWKDNILFDYRPEEITAVRLEYPQSPRQSFVITVDKGQEPRLGPVAGPALPGSVDRQEVAVYLSNFSGVRYFAGESPVCDTSALKEPFAILTIKGSAEDVFRMQAYRIPGDGEKDYDVYRYCALLAGDSLPLTVKYADTDLVMKTYSDFLKK